MPLINSMGMLRDMTATTSVTYLVKDQWISQFVDPTSSPEFRNFCVPADSGNVYMVDGDTLGLVKLNSNGTKVYSYTLSVPSPQSTTYECYPHIDASENIYVGGQWDTQRTFPTWAGNIPILIKYDSSGNILWQTGLDVAPVLFGSAVLDIETTSAGDLFVLTGMPNGYEPKPGSYGPDAAYVLFKLDPTTGAIINQRKVLKQATTSTTEMIVDTVNSKLILAGTDYSTLSLLIGYYDFTNTDTASTILYQKGTTEETEIYFSGQSNNNLVTDGTYVYAIAYRHISGITRSVYMKINKTTGAVSYSNAIVVGGNSLTLTGISIDTSGHIYISAGSAGPFSGRAVIAKLNTSDGTVVWAKTLGGDPYGESIGAPTWKAGYVYFNASVTSATSVFHNACIKLYDDGSLPNGTYGTWWTFASTSPTLVSYMPTTTGTTTGTNSTTTYGTYAPSTTSAVDTDGVTVYYIP